MTDKRKKLIRQRMQETGRSYQSVVNELRKGELHHGKLANGGGDARVLAESQQLIPMRARRAVLRDADKWPRRHPHGYKLLVYRGKTQENWHEREVIWNSRNAKAPAYIRGVNGNKLVMVDLAVDDDGDEPNGDRFAPEYVPQVGERVFVELTEERAQIVATAQIALEWYDPAQRAELDYHFATREEAVRETADFLLDEDYPDLVVVTPVFLAELSRQRTVTGAASSW